ncbi:MAG TPA: alkaline phosphatase family protein [Thermoanaerobaculia bacterium]|nr:alkaline phosphatase family protein [Thermoanaerobaculia bacterium]
MRRIAFISTVLILAAVIGIIFIRVQPAGMARVTRHGARVDVNSARVAFVVPGGASCFAPVRGNQLFLRHSFRGLSIGFAYEPPATLPDNWPSGDWCSSLDAFVDERLRSTSADIPANPREAEASISTEMLRTLTGAHLRPVSVSVRIQLPQGWERTRPVPEVVQLAKPAAPLVFVGLDGADWQLLDDYIARGAMPNLARLVREGTSGTLDTEHPPLSPLLWTTMMTGVSPLGHQILDFTHFNHVTGAKEPITSDERAVPAIWNMATEGGKRVAVFGLWATYPAEPVRGLLVSDRLFTFLYSESAPPPGVVFPPAREEWARSAVSAAENSIDFAALRRYLPWLSEQQANDLAHEANPYAKPGSALRRILVETEVYRRLANDVLSHDMPDLSIIYIQGTDTIGHVFAPFAPPKQPEVSDDDYARYNQVPELYFRHIDDILGEFLRAAERNHARMMLASDHGFLWKEGRPATLSSVAIATAAKWHRNEGIVLLWGPGIPSSGGHHIHGGIRQVCATLLDVCGLPRDSHVAGPPLMPAREVAVIDYRRWFERFVPATPNAVTAASANEELSKLRALGYIGSGESTSARSAGASTKTAGSYNNEGLILKHDNRIDDAIAAFHQALALDPNLASAAWNLSDLLFSRNESLAEADTLLLLALQNGLPEAPTYVVERAIKYQRSGHAGRSLELLEGAVARSPENSELRMFRGRYRIDQKNCAGALEDFQAAERLRSNDAIAFASAGLAQICLGDHAGAQGSFERSLQINPNQPQLRQFLQQ